MDFQQFKNKYQQTEVVHYPNKVPDDVLISVLVQAYNHEKYIVKCLDSIIAQKTNFQYEILLGEDGSSDNTRKICIEYALKYPKKIKLFLHHNENKIKVVNILTGNFNALYNFYQARGKFIAFCEGDDYWDDSYKLQKQINFLEQNKEYISSYHPFLVIRKNEIKLNDHFYLAQPSTDIAAEDLKKLKFHPHISTICFKKVFHELPEQISDVINIDSFIISLLGNYGNMKFIKDIKPSLYRRHTGGIWTNETKKIKYQYKALIYNKLEEYYKDIGENELEVFYNTEKKNVYKMQLLFQLKNVEILMAIKTFKSLLKM